MRTINTASGMTSLLLGRLGENERTQFVFDVADWLEEYPDATITLYFQKPHSSESYPVVISQPENGKVVWTVADSELQETGYGKCELVAVQGETVVKGHIWKTNVLDSLDGAGDPPDPWDSWMEEFTRMKGEAEDAAEDAAESAEDAAEAAAEAAQEAVQEMIDDTAGDGDTDKVWSASKLTSEFSDVLRTGNAEGPYTLQDNEGGVYDIGYLSGDLKVAVPFKHIRAGDSIKEETVNKTVDGKTIKLHYLYDTGVKRIYADSTPGRLVVEKCTGIDYATDPDHPVWSGQASFVELFNVASTTETQAIIAEYAG